jgi:hypothetical protein
MTLLTITKFLHNLTPFNPDIVFHIYTPPEASKSNSPYLQKPNNAATTRLSSFFCRCIDAWNYLPSNLRHAQSIPQHLSEQLNALICPGFSKAHPSNSM